MQCSNVNFLINIKLQYLETQSVQKNFHLPEWNTITYPDHILQMSLTFITELNAVSYISTTAA